ncbi:DUF4331 domain-containing protein [Massilia suwonensis]|uniref:DUF4331 domain-containing protein n=1 Tax=Massilia suwonensis TaxID=648895 RepID=A0ABW0MRW5_9BURK
MRPMQKYSLWAAALLTGSALLALSVPAGASSHREAPFLTTAPKVDGTDFYLFRSYAPGRAGYVTMIANFIPFQDAYGGPNFFQFDQNALYQIRVDNNGDAREDISFQLRFKNTSKRTALNIGGQQVLIPLINSSTISGVNPAALNVRETYTIDMVRSSRQGLTRTRLAAANGATEFDKPVDNIGDKVFGGPGGYEAYANQHIYDVAVPGCGTGRVFVGQRRESFYIAVGKIFDLFNLNPLGPEAGGNENDLDDKNVSSIALEMPIGCLAAPGEPVIGAYATASVRQGRLLDRSPASGINNLSREAGPWVQVSRLGMPLVNEVIIGLDDKDRFNASRPRDDAQFATYVTNPVLPAVVESLFPAARAPTNFPRTDLVTVFLKGLPGVNQPRNVVASEMMRLNTGIAPTAQAAQNPLGVAGGDNAGFPNGRRPGDDVVDIELRVAMGALCALSGSGDALGVGCGPGDAPAGALPLTDGVRLNAGSYKAAFPYLNTPLPGNQP